jgi:outer membrane protein OmpA-like peptidoglycan-associated protein
MEVGQKIVLRNIFFDFNKSSLRPESNVELENLLKLLNENTKMKIEISGHTDNVGSAQYNKKLSESRAKSVVDYLTSKGINKDRLSFAGYGFDEPIAPNDTEEGRQLNRRTEFKIVQN